MLISYINYQFIHVIFLLFYDFTIIIFSFLLLNSKLHKTITKLQFAVSMKVIKTIYLLCVKINTTALKQFTQFTDSKILICVAFMLHDDLRHPNNMFHTCKQGPGIYLEIHQKIKKNNCS